jgi:hypothetical protein
MQVGRRHVAFGLWTRGLLSLRLERTLVAKQDKTIAATLTLSAQPDFLKNMTLKAKAIDRAGKAVEREIAAPSPRQVRLAIPVSDMSPGVCRLQVEAFLSGVPCGRAEKPFDLLAGELPF